MIELAHHNDGKEKWQSHEVYLIEEEFYNHEYGLYSHDIFDAIGYGETQEEALEDFKRKMNYMFEEYKALEKILFQTNWLTDNMVEVDCFGKKVNK